MVLLIVTCNTTDESESDSTPSSEMEPTEEPAEEPADEPADEPSEESSEGPTFNAGQDPKPDGEVWEKIAILSDEFNEKDTTDPQGLNPAKWSNGPTTTFPWQGSPQCKFVPWTIKVDDNDSNAAVITVSKLPTQEDTRIYAGGILRSKETAKVGTFFECRMKANATQMSSSFWAINSRNQNPEGECKRTTELDIQEGIGDLKASPPAWATNWERIYHSNLLNRETAPDCAPEYENSQEQRSVLNEIPNSEEYHTYGCWWKNENEFIFYLDGEETYRMSPQKGDFRFPLYIVMSSNVYSWNEYPANDPTFNGMEGLTAAERSTTFDWIRCWNLK